MESPSLIQTKNDVRNSLGGGEAELDSTYSAASPTLLFPSYHLLFTPSLSLFFSFPHFTLSLLNPFRLLLSSDMASEPSEEAISDFVNFTSTSRQQAINFLKVR